VEAVLPGDLSEAWKLCRRKWFRPTGLRRLCMPFFTAHSEYGIGAHRLPTDEIFHFYLGHPGECCNSGRTAAARDLVLGTDLFAGQIRRRGAWRSYGRASMLESLLGTNYDADQNFSLEQWQESPEPDLRFALLGATMAPGFDYADYQSGNLGYLRRRFPAKAELIRLLCLELEVSCGALFWVVEQFAGALIFAFLFPWTAQGLPACSLPGVAIAFSVGVLNLAGRAPPREVKHHQSLFHWISYFNSA